MKAVWLMIMKHVRFDSFTGKVTPRGEFLSLVRGIIVVGLELTYGLICNYIYPEGYV